MSVRPSKFNFFSSFAYTTAMGFSPIYLMAPFVLFFTCLTSVRLNRAQVFLSGIFLIWFVFIVLNAFVGDFHTDYTYKYVFGIFLNILFWFSGCVSVSQGLKSRWLEFIVFCFVGFDTVFRFSYPSEFSSDIYRFKENSFIFEDSNFVGFFLLFFAIFRDHVRGSFSFRFDFLVFLLLFLTFSRASLFVYCLYVIVRRISLNGFLLGGLLLSAVAAGLFLFYDNFFSEIVFAGTFKFNNASLILSGFFQNLTLISFFFGHGLGWSSSISGYSAHAYFVEVLVEQGIMAIVFWFSALILSFRNSRGSAAIFVFMFIIISFSFSPIVAPYLFFFLGVLFTTTDR